MSTERRRSTGGRRRAGAPGDDPPGSGGRRKASRPPADDHPGSRSTSSTYAEGGRRGSPPPRASAGDYNGRRRAAAHGARSESGRRRRPADHDDRNGFQRFCAKAWKPFLVISGLGVVASIAVFALLYFATTGPDELRQQAGAAATATVIRFEDGGEVGSVGEINRVEVGINDIPDSVINGVLGSEERRFYEDPAVSPTGLARAVLSGGSEGGGSGITQQMARNYYDTLSQEQTYTRKIREILISIKVGQQLSKDQILEQYLNTIYFGRGAYGIQAAAQAYFGKDISELDDAEGAFMGAIIQQPGNFENAQPGDEIWEILEERWQYSVDGMVTMHEEGLGRGGISQADANELEFPEPVARESGGSYEGYNGYVIEAVKRELRDRYDLTDERIQGGGFQVTTSIDEDLMAAAQEAVTNNVPEDVPEETNFGLAAVDPATGEIKAFYGGDDVFQDTDNSLIQTGQAGSAYKPYVLATGIENGIGLGSQFDGDSPQRFEGISEPIQNNENQSWGEVDLVDSTTHSINTSFVELAIRVGPQEAADMATRAGVRPGHTETADIGPNIALGTYFVTALDQAAGYSTFANEGVHLPQHMVTEVIDPEGDVLEPADAEEIRNGDQVINPDVAADVTYAMTQVVEEGSGQSAVLDDGRPVAGKTGTSNDAASAWFVGFTPQLSTAVGLHRSDNQPLTIPGMDTLYGSTVPAAIWNDFMTEAMADLPIEQFPQPAFVGNDQNFLPTPSPEPEPTPEPREEEDDEDQRREDQDDQSPDDEPFDPCEFDPNFPGCQDDQDDQNDDGNNGIGGGNDDGNDDFVFPPNQQNQQQNN